VSAAVAGLTRLGCAPDVAAADVPGGQPPGEVIGALEIIALSCLRALSPADGGSGVLRSIGLAAAVHDAGVPL
jgi:hypothetical protein